MLIKLIDGSEKEFDSGMKLIGIAKAISPELAKKSVVARVDGVLCDLSKEITKDCVVEFILQEDPIAFEVLNHSCSHMMAEAVKRLYPGTFCGVGPAIEEGFYYDFHLPVTLKPEDLGAIEKEMAKIVKENNKFEHSVISKKDALEMFKLDPYKTQLIEAIEEDEVGLYKQGDYVDICRGPHVMQTSILKNFKLLSIAGAYWRGDSNNEMLTRIYGTCYFTKEELEKHLVDLEERKKRDHRKLGRELGLFMLSDYGPGLPFWLPNGFTLRRTLEDDWLKYHKAHGYKVIETPIMLSKKLWETSGHWDHYKEDMYITKVDEEEYAIKPMNCPGAILVYQNDIHSYKELPLRYAELGHVHRHEASGALNGLFRVRTFTQDDAHILLMESQIGEEVSRILKLYDHYYSLFGLNYQIELSTRPESNYIGDIATWDQAEEDLKKACLATGHSFKINPGDGAFYGPKLDFKLRDSMNRIWQCGTVQLDMQLPGRFNCTYISEDGSKKTPVMIHRACFGSLERFMGILIENYAGAFPTWLSPVQVKLIPVSNENHKQYCDELLEEFNFNDIRTEADYREEKLGYRMRDAQIHKIPFTLVIGDNECENKTVTYRRFGSTEQVTIGKDEFIDLIHQLVKEYK